MCHPHCLDLGVLTLPPLCHPSTGSGQALRGGRTDSLPSTGERPRVTARALARVTSRVTGWRSPRDRRESGSGAACSLIRQHMPDGRGCRTGFSWFTRRRRGGRRELSALSPDFVAVTGFRGPGGTGPARRGWVRKLSPMPPRGKEAKQLSQTGGCRTADSRFTRRRGAAKGRGN